MAYPAANWYMNGSGCSDILTEAIGRGPVAVDWVNSGGGGSTRKKGDRGAAADEDRLIFALFLAGRGTAS